MGKTMCICCGKDIEKCKTRVPSSSPVPYGSFIPIPEQESYHVSTCREGTDLFESYWGRSFTIQRKHQYVLPTGGRVTRNVAHVSWPGHIPHSSRLVEQKAKMDVASGIGPLGIRHRLMETVLARSQGPVYKKASPKKG